MPNRLVHETSPYLLQHAHNPVDWFPWGAEALQRAKDEDIPILLSVGYSACHWCHVMERESFEDAETAGLMNRYFVNVKVDREERPDIDEIYMKAVQAFSGGHGGWPMTVFLTPEGKPYFGGTYFPPEPRHGMPSFSQVLQHAHNLYHRDRERVNRVTGELLQYLQDATRMPRPETTLKTDWLGPVTRAASEGFDARLGGFGEAPKFPPHGTLRNLLAQATLTGDAKALKMATETLDAMARGGMYDLLAGGFCRYSVDAEWRVPHFEKMLYDNGQLIPVYLLAWQMTGQPHYARIAQESSDYLLREMTTSEGAFAASQDADSEGEEGKFFAWTPAQLIDALGAEDGTRVAALLEVTAEGTFEHGASVLRSHLPLEQLPDDDRDLLQRSLPVLQHERARRIAPGRDDKVITAWNGLAIGALARAGAVLSAPRFTEAAVRAATFILAQMQPAGPDGNPRLMRTFKDGRARLLGYADDYAVLIDSLIDLYETTFDLRWLRSANALTDRMLELFWDDDKGGLFYTGADAESLVTRSKNIIGGAEPAANEVAALAMLRLESLSGRRDLGEKADHIIRAYQSLLERAPRALSAVAIAGTWRIGASQEIAIIGDRLAAAPLLDVLRAHPHPLRVVACSPEDAIDVTVLPWLEGRRAVGGQPTAYLCENFSCKLPTTDPAELRAQIQESLRPERTQKKPRVRVRAPALPSDPAAWQNVDAPLTLQDLRGNVVVLDFWTYCCVNCLHVLPELAAIEEMFEGQPVAIVGVHAAKFSTEKEADSVSRAIDRHQIRHPVVLDPTHDLWDRYAIRSWPTLVVLDVQGRIAWQQSGEVNRAALRAVIQGLLDEAREAGTLGEAAWSRPSPAAHTGLLRHPGKVSVHPPPIAQAAEDADPFGADSRLYVADTGHHRILELVLVREGGDWPKARLLRTFGDGQPGLVDGAPEAARFRMPQGMTRTEDTLWVADTDNHAIRAIDLNSGTVTTMAGTGHRGEGIDLSARDPKQIALRSPWDVDAATDNDGAAIVLIAMAGTHQIWIFFPERGQIGPFIGSGVEEHVDGPPDQAALAQPSGMVLAGHYLFFVDSETSSVRAYRMDERHLGTLAGQGLFDFGDIDGKGDAVRLQHPLGITLGIQELYIADTFNHKIKTLRMRDGQVTTLAGGDPQTLSEPGGLDRAGDFLIIADTNNHRLRIAHRETGEIRDLEVDWG